MKKKFISLFVLSLSLLSSLSLLACKTPPQVVDNQSVTQQLIAEQSLKGDINKNWDFFLQETSIQELLDFVFDNEEEKTKYIESQKNIDSPEFLKQIQTATYYFNYILASYTPQPRRSLFGKNESDRPYIVDQSKQFFDELFTKNWLWILFNMNKLSFVFNVDIDLFKYRGEVDQFEDDVLRSNVLNGAFYHPTNPQFIQYAKKISFDNLSKKVEKTDDGDEMEFRKDLQFYLLNSDGMIIKIDIKKSYDANKQLTNTKVDMSSYLYTYPKLLSSEDKNRDFSLSKYIQVNEVFTDQDENDIQAPTFEKILFQDQYGGDFLQYAFIGARKIK